MDKKIILLEEEDVIKTHDTLLQISGGLAGISQERSLNSTLHRINNHMDYLDKSDIYEVAALYAISIAQGHPFNDGNKRTAMACMVFFLNSNGVALSIDEKELEQNPISKKIIESVKKAAPNEISFWGVGLTESDIDLMELYQGWCTTNPIINVINPNIEVVKRVEKILQCSVRHSWEVDEWLEENQIS